MNRERMEELVGRALGEELRERGVRAADLERRLDLPGGLLDDLLAGRGPLDMAALRRILTLLGVAPESFFTRVFAPGQGGGPAHAAGSFPGQPPGGGDGTPGRHQVAGLIDRVRQALEEIAVLTPTPSDAGGDHTR